MKRNQTLRLTYGGLLAALIALATVYVRIPVPMDTGYAHLGDAAIALAALLLGPYAAIPAAVGSALADVLAEWAIYAPFTAVIKGLIGYGLGRWLEVKRSLGRNTAVLIAAGATIVVGYFAVDALLYGYAAAVASIFGNCVQAVALLVIGSALAPMVGSLPEEIRRNFPR